MYVQCTYIFSHVTCVVLRSEVNKSGISGSATAKKTVKKTQPIGDKVQQYSTAYHSFINCLIYTSMYVC